MPRATVSTACALVLALAGLPAMSRAAPQEKADPLTRARVLYNQRDYMGAVDAAEQARLVIGHADSADLIAARAYIERFRESAASDDLTNARNRLRQLDPLRLAPAERIEFSVGLGETLFFDGLYGAAADVLESVLTRENGLSPDARELVLDWWATSVDRDARSRPEVEKQEELYGRLHTRMSVELGTQPASTAAGYWLAVALRGLGDLQGAWDAAEAGWVRAPLAADHGAALRGDLDRLVLSAIAPERAKALGQPLDRVQQAWDEFKERWTR